MASRWRTRLVVTALAGWNVLCRAGQRRPPRTVRRVLIAQNMLLGDTIMLAPLLKKLREQFPHAEILVTCKPQFVELFARAPYCVRALPFDPRDARTFFELYRARGFDLAILPADNRLSWLARSLDARWIVAFEGDRPGHKNWLVDELRPYPDHALAFGDLVAACLVDGPPPAPYRPSEWLAPSAPEFALPPGPYGVLHVGASNPLRHWEPEKWRAVIAHLEAGGIRPVLSAGPGEGTLIEQIDPDARLAAFPGTLSLAQLWRLLARATVVVCPDTGIGHMARLAGVPLVVLFGPGSATMFGGGEFWKEMPDCKVTIPGFPCRTDNIVFRRHLPWAEHCARSPARCASPRCMHALTVQMVTAAIDSLLRNSIGSAEHRLPPATA